MPFRQLYALDTLDLMSFPEGGSLRVELQLHRPPLEHSERATMIFCHDLSKHSARLARRSMDGRFWPIAALLERHLWVESSRSRLTAIDPKPMPITSKR